MVPWIFRLIALVVVALCLLYVFAVVAGGWFTLVGIWFWPLVGLAHLVAHSIRLPRSGKVQCSRLALTAISHALLVFGFLLQVDVGDHIVGPQIAVRVNYFLSDYGIGGDTLGNIVVFVPVFVSWVLLLILPTGQPGVAASSAPANA